jgi:hypothetical protein
VNTVSLSCMTPTLAPSPMHPTAKSFANFLKIH